MKLDLKQLPLKENAIIVWRTEDVILPDPYDLCRTLGAAGYKCPLVILGPGQDLTVLSDEELDRMGLQRKEEENNGNHNSQ